MYGRVCFGEIIKRDTDLFSFSFSREIMMFVCDGLCLFEPLNKKLENATTTLEGKSHKKMAETTWAKWKTDVCLPLFVWIVLVQNLFAGFLIKTPLPRNSQKHNKTKAFVPSPGTRACVSGWPASYETRRGRRTSRRRLAGGVRIREGVVVVAA
jgi:hypothetical protein